MTKALQLAQMFHEIYERLAPDHGYETRKDSAVPWQEVPPKNKALMIAVCAEILEKIRCHNCDLGDFDWKEVILI